MSEQLNVAIGTITSGWGNLSNYFWIILVVLGILVIGTILFFIGYYFKSKEKWNVVFRIRQENTLTNTIYLDPIEVKGKRVTLSNGLRLFYLEKEVLGKRLFPNLNHYTKPGVYDLIITADNRIFLIEGIEGIDEKRKILKVGVRYPGIDYSLDEVDRDHAKLNKMDRRSDLVAMVKAASIAIVAIVLLVGLIVGGKYWLDAKELDNSKANAELQLLDGIQKYQVTQLEQTQAMSILTEKMKQLLGTTSIQGELNKLT